MEKVEACLFGYQSFGLWLARNNLVFIGKGINRKEAILKVNSLSWLWLDAIGGLNQRLCFLTSY